MKQILFLSAAVFALSGCDAVAKFSKPKQKPVAEMSSQELLDALASGVSGNRERAIKLRLARSYGTYGSEAQKLEYAGYLTEMAKTGDHEAGAMLCSDVYMNLAGKDGYDACEAAAEAGKPKAISKVCRINYKVEAFQDAVKFCAQGEELGLTDTYLHMGMLTAKGLGGAVKSPYRAIPILGRAAEEGPWQDRDAAIDMLRDIPEAVAYADYIDLEEKRGVGQRAAVLTQRVEPVIPRGLSQRGQCYLRYEITPTGLVYKARVECNNDILIEPVLQAAHGWRFEPRTVQGTAMYSRGQSTTLVFEVK